MAVTQPRLAESANSSGLPTGTGEGRRASATHARLAAECRSTGSLAVGTKQCSHPGTSSSKAMARVGRKPVPVSKGCWC